MKNYLESLSVEELRFKIKDAEYQVRWHRLEGYDLETKEWQLKLDEYRDALKRKEGN